MGLRFAPQTGILRDFVVCVGLIRSHPEHGQEANIRGRPATLERNRRAAIENIIDTDPVAALVREIMADRGQWTGSASDLLQVGAKRSGWPKSPRALAGRLRRAQTFLRILGIEVGFGREGRLGTRTIRITAIGEDRSRNTVCTVCSVRGDGARVGTTAAAIGGESATTVSPRFGRPVPAIGLVLSQAADDAADGADANAAFQGGPTDSGSV